MLCTAFKRRELFQDVLCSCDYAERVVASFTNKIKSEYYGGNRSVTIEGTALEHFSASPKADSNSSTISYQRHAAFHSFYLKIANMMLPLLQHIISQEQKNIDNFI